MFPRLNERGSIEAWAGSAPMFAKLKAFPRLNERGSIEARSPLLGAPHWDLVSTFE